MLQDLSALSKKIKLPHSWRNATKSELIKIRGVCLDIDDTLSTSGKLTPEAYRSLWDLKNSGLAVVPITGRPAGWCDHIVRFWPVDAVVGENGAFTFYMEKGIRKRIETDWGAKKKDESQRKFEKLKKKICLQFPHAQWASDQAYREYDLAVDICEDVSPWSEKDIQSLLALCHAAGAHAKRSSIHVNIWWGEYDKRTGFEFWIDQGAPGCPGKVPAKDSWLYIGDSPNDEPLFASFSLSVGVANLKKYLNILEHYPNWITQAESGQGFSEMAKKLLRALRS